MATFRKTFSQGRVNLDVDNRLLPDGEYREANNIIVINNESNEEGGIRKSYSNKRLTNLDLGTNPITLGGFTYDARNKIYWLVVSDNGCYFIEYDNASQTTAFILKDTRSLATRVFDLKKDFPITGINIVTHEDPKKELILLTDNNMQPLCINPERAKTYGANGFEKEDIFLIKKPPRYAPTVTSVYVNDGSNNLENKFLTFSYRYKYLDGEYSALSSYSNYNFTPKKFNLDYFTLVNKGMVNRFNAVKVEFNTGEKQVLEVQIIVKESNSNILYVVKTFNKKNEEWGENTIKSIIFSNKNIYLALPEKELYRSFDNVPLKALALTLIGNIPVFGNYLEGYDLKDINGIEIDLNYDLSIINKSLESGFDFNVLYPDTNKITFEHNPQINYIKDYTIYFLFSVTISGTSVYENEFSFVLPQDYLNLNQLVLSPEFLAFTQLINQHYISNYNSENQYNVDPAYSIGTETSISFAIVLGVPTFTVNPIIYLDTSDADSPVIVNTSFFSTSNVSITSINNASSCKTNRSYQIGMLYLDEFNRSTTTLICNNNTIFIPQSFSVFKNNIRVNINHKPPFWADRYKFVVKSNIIDYQTIYVNEFYNEDNFVWAKLQSDNKDKVKIGDNLLAKVAGGVVISYPNTIKVLDIKTFEKDFIKENIDDNGNDIIETAGVYMKIRPEGFSMDIGDYKVNQSKVGDVGSSGIPRCFLDLFSITDEITNAVTGELAINQGSSIYIMINSSRNYNSGWKDVRFEKTYFAQRNYSTIEEWFNENLLNGSIIPGVVLSNDDIEDYAPNIELIRGNFSSSQVFSSFIEDVNGKLFLKVRGLLPGGSNGRDGYCRAEIVVRNSTGIYVFETDKKQFDQEIFYETEQVFDIINNEHQGNLQHPIVQNQNNTTFAPAIIDLDFFNCYTQGNGVESYRFKDELNVDYLNIDLRPSTVSIDGYKQIRRFADLTYGEAFNESSNINGLNVFNLSTANFKDDIDKQYGSIQKLYARENDILVIQKEKAGKVLFDKNALYTAEGNPSITSTNSVLGQYIPYRGNRGIGNNRESFSVDEDGRIKYASVRNGSIVRLSLDGVEDIVYGVKSFFRDLFINQPNARVISGYDPFLDQTVFSIGNEPARVPLFQCSNQIIKSGQDSEFRYNLQLNNLGGDIVFTYNITSGSATIMVEFNDITEVVSNVTGTGTITVPRNSLILNIATITITPTTPLVSYTIDNTCPIGSELEIVMVVVNDENDTDKTIINRFRTLGTSFVSTEDLFLEAPITRFESITGLEGVGSFPANGSVVNIQAQKNSSNNGKFELDKCNRMGFLISSVNYTEASYLSLLNNIDTEFITIIESGEGDAFSNWSGNFIFNRSSPTEKLYLIWDYSDRQPVLADDSASVTSGGVVIIDVLVNDSVDITSIVTIAVAPLHGTAVVNVDKTISYTHDGTSNFEDEFTYQVSNGGCISTAKVFISVGVDCSGGINAGGGTGIYEAIINVGTDLGLTGITYNSFGVSDRFEIFYNNVKVADSKYVGDDLSPGPPVFGTGLLGLKTGFNIFAFNGSPIPPNFDPTGLIEPDFTVVQGDIANNITEPTDGNGTLMFNKTTALPTTMKIRVTGPVGATAWNFQGLCPFPEELLKIGTHKIVYGFYNEANKTSLTKIRSKKFFLQTSPLQFYTNERGMIVFGSFGWTSDLRFFNDGVTWWEIDAFGAIISSGTI